MGERRRPGRDGLQPAVREHGVDRAAQLRRAELSKDPSAPTARRLAAGVAGLHGGRAGAVPAAAIDPELGVERRVRRAHLDRPERGRPPGTVPVDRRPNTTYAFQFAGLAALTRGLVVVDLRAVVGGLLLVQCAKAWFIDRMGLLFRMMAERDPRYASWEY
ncbi:MAG TPA: DUF6653 family protein [Geodermatophilus sp.]|nr:DUF6653 family protein [Geodermatophilus sp.]